MERRRAWVTAVTIGITFIVAALAVMANTGILRMSRPQRSLGRITPADLLLPARSVAGPAELLAEPVTIASSTTIVPRVVVKYEDVYVTAAGEPVPAATVPVGPTSTAPTTTAPTTRATVAPSAKPARKRRTSATLKAPVTRVASDDDDDGETHDGDDDDD